MDPFIHIHTQFPFFPLIGKPIFRKGCHIKLRNSRVGMGQNLCCKNDWGWTSIIRSSFSCFRVPGFWPIAIHSPGWKWKYLESAVRLLFELSKVGGSCFGPWGAMMTDVVMRWRMHDMVYIYYICEYNINIHHTIHCNTLLRKPAGRLGKVVLANKVSIGGLGGGRCRVGLGARN